MLKKGENDNLMSRVIKIENNEQKNEIMLFLRSGTLPTGLDKEQRRRFRQKASHFQIANEQLCFRKPTGGLKRAVFDFETEIIQMILEEEHAHGHPGINKMVDLIHRKYYGVSSAVIKDFVKACGACSSTNTLTTVADIHVNEITAKWDRYIMDCVDLRRYSEGNDGYCWILNVIDTYTKYLFSFKLKNKTAESVRDCLEHIYVNFGVPVSIQADNGKEFSNELLRQYHANLQVRVIHGRPRNPQAQGQVERVNQTIKRWLAKSLANDSRKRWIDHLHKVVFTYNVTKHRATNQSPFQLFHGHPGFNNFQPIPEEREASEDLDREDLEWVFENENENDASNDPMPAITENVGYHFARYRQAMIAHSNPNTRRRRLEVGDRVLLKLDFDNNPGNRRASFDPFFEPVHYIVQGILENNMIKIKHSETLEERNVFKNRLKKLNQ